jgi:hypothetical protein
MGIYDRRHHHPLADAGAAVWADPFRYMASGSASGTGVELPEPKFEPHPMAPHDVHDLALVQEGGQMPPSPDSSDDQEPARPGHKVRHHSQA